MPEQPASSARLRRIGRTLQELREAKGWSQQRSGVRLERSGSSLSLIENGLQPLRIRDLLYMLDVYGVTDPTLRENLITLAEQDRQTGWWSDFQDIASPADLDYASLEYDATRLDTVEMQFVPGLLQTEDYARAVIRASLSGHKLADAERLVDYRMARQGVLRGADPPSLRIVIDEAALRRARGGQEVMQAQLRRLLEEARKPHITLQVLPFSCAADPGVNGMFTLLEIGRPAILTMVLISHLTGRWSLKNEVDILRYREAFNLVRGVALSERESCTLIQQLISEP